VCYCDDPAGRRPGPGRPDESPAGKAVQEESTHGTAHWARGAKTRSPYD